MENDVTVADRNTKAKLSEFRWFGTWIVFYLSSVIGGAMMGLVAGAVVGEILAILGFDTKVIAAICAVLGFVLGAILSYALFRILVQKMIVDKIV